MAAIGIKARVGGVWRDETIGGGSPERPLLLVVADGETLARVRAAMTGALARTWTVGIAVTAEQLTELDKPEVALVDPDLPEVDVLVSLLEAGGVPWISLGGSAVSGSLGNLEPAELNRQALGWALRYVLERSMPMGSAEDDDRTQRIMLAGEVAASVAHEINNPLTYLLTNLEHVEQALTEARASAPLIEAVSEAREGAERLSYIVGELGKVTRAPTRNIEPVYVDRLLESVITMAQPHLRDKARTRNVCEALHPVSGNEARLFQVLLNLVINAAQAIEPGALANHEVRVGTRWKEGRRIEIYVQDTGHGIAPENLARVFEPYFTTKAGRKGTGLGLALCRRYIEEMGGTIEVESQLGCGSTFKLSLPVARGGTDRPTLVPDFDGRAASILVVDDEHYIGRAFARALSMHRVVVAESGAEALRHLAERPFDLMFTDVLMPGMSGIELYQRVSSGWPELARRVVFLSGGGLDPAASAFLESIENPRFQKPVGAQQLRDIVSAVLRQR